MTYSQMRDSLLSLCEEDNQILLRLDVCESLIKNTELAHSLPDSAFDALCDGMLAYWLDHEGNEPMEAFAYGLQLECECDDELELLSEDAMDKAWGRGHDIMCEMILG